MKRTNTVRSLAVAALIAAPALAQSGNGYNLTWNTIDSGGQMFSIGNGYELGGTIGQPDAGLLTGAGGYALKGGFWLAAVPDACAGEVQLYGDIAPVPPQPGAGSAPGNGVVDLDDILCVLDDFANPANCAGNGNIAPCTPNGVIDLDDILAVLDAFSASYACPHPCPP